MNDECKYQASEYALSAYNIALSCAITLADCEELCVINVTEKGSFLLDWWADGSSWANESAG